MKMAMSPQDIFSCDIYFKFAEKSARKFSFFKAATYKCCLTRVCPCWCNTLDILRLITMVLFLVNNLCAKLEQFQHFQYFQHIVLYKIYDSFCQNMMYNKESIHQHLLPLQKLFVFAERGRFRSAKRLQRILWQPGCARWQGGRTEAELRKPKTFSDLKV